MTYGLLTNDTTRRILPGNSESLMPLQGGIIVSRVACSCSITASSELNLCSVNCPAPPCAGLVSELDL